MFIHEENPNELSQISLNQSFGRVSLSRSSIVEDLRETSSPRSSVEPINIDLNAVFYSYLKQLKISSKDSSVIEQALSSLLSVRRHTDYARTLETILKPLYISFTREIHLFQAMIAITRLSIAKSMLLAKKFDMDTEWKTLENNLTQEYLEGINTPINDIQTFVSNFIESYGCSRFSGDISAYVITYFKFRAEQEGLVLALSNLAQHLVAITISDSFIDDRLCERDCFIELELAKFLENRKYFSLSTREDHEREKLKEDLKAYLGLSLIDLDIEHDLEKKDLAGKKLYLKSIEKELLELDAAFAVYKEPSLEVDYARYALTNAIQKMQPEYDVVLPNVDRLTDTKIKLYNSKDNSQNALFFIIQCRNETFFEKILEYATFHKEQHDLVRATLDQGLDDHDLCWLAARQNCFLFNLNDVAKIQNGISTGLVDYQDSESDSRKPFHFFDKNHHFIIPDRCIAVADRELLRGIFDNYKSYDNVGLFASIFRTLLNKAEALDDPDLIIDIATYIELNLKENFFTEEKLKEHVGPNTLAYLISNDGLCDHELLRKELKHRYVKGPQQAQRLMNLENPVKIALQEKYDFYQHVDRVADFYHAASLHVIEKSLSVSNDDDKRTYQSKLQSISTVISENLDPNSVDDALDLSDQANTIADRLIDAPGIQKNTGLFHPCCGLNKTQTEINKRQKALRWGPKKRELNRETIKIGDSLTANILNQIPLSKEEQEACAKRAVEARAVFKATLDYLSNRYGKNDNKFKILEQRIDYYIRGYGDDNQEEYNAQKFLEQLNQDLKDSSNLAEARHWWTTLFKNKPKTIEKLEKAGEKLEKAEKILNAIIP
ncbi:MAG: hypothetical protein LRY67_04955 [Gammaproteobacteria bacterium]|nr:hypothetical protein [Gammaproteobacteria bacterium]